MPATIVQEIDPKINYPRLNELSTELTQFLTRLEALYIDAVAGFELVRSRVVSDQETVRNLLEGTECDSEEFQNGRLFSYDLIFKGDFCGSDLHRVSQGEVKTRNQPGGSNYIMLGRLCIVALSDYWNDYLRRQYVIAKGQLDPTESNDEIVKERLKEHGSFDLWGDLSKILNAIVHNAGVGNSKLKSCRLIRWFKESDAIDITPAVFQAILFAVYRFRNQLHNEQFPKSHIRISRT